MKIIDKYSKDEFQQIVNECNTLNELICKLGYSKFLGGYKQVIEYIEKYNIDISCLQHYQPKRIIRAPENIFIENSTASQHVLRNYYKKGNYTEYKCAICGLEPFWNGQEITLTLDHINGDNRDDRLENLRWVCPNCDRQLPTFCGKNKRNPAKYIPEIYNEENLEKINNKNYCQICGKEISKNAKICIGCYGKSQRKVADRPEPEELRKILLEHNGNFSEVGRLFEVQDNTIRKWCKKYNMPYHSNDYKQNSKKEKSYHKRLNYLEVVKLYQEEQEITKVAKELDADVGTIRDILVACNIPIKSSTEIIKEKYGKAVYMLDKNKNIINTFDSIKEAGMYIFTQGISKSKDIKGIASHIGDVCLGKRVSAYGYYWQYKE